MDRGRNGYALRKRLPIDRANGGGTTSPPLQTGWRVPSHRRRGGVLSLGAGHVSQGPTHTRDVDSSRRAPGNGWGAQPRALRGEDTYDVGLWPERNLEQVGVKV